MTTNTIGIVDIGRGPQLSTNRITVQDLLPYYRERASNEEIRRWIPTLSDDEIAVLKDYIRDNNDQVLKAEKEIQAYHDHMRARSRTGPARTTTFPLMSGDPDFGRSSSNEMRRKTVLTILLDENIEGYADYLSRFIFSSAWSEISSSLDMRLVAFEEIGLVKGTPDKQIWEFCQQEQVYLLTDNRNQHTPDSFETLIRTRTLPSSLPVFTISDIQRLRTDRTYVEAIVAKLLEYLMDANNLRGTGRLYLP